MTAETFYLYMSCLATVGLILSVVALRVGYKAMKASEYNAYVIQSPWFEDYKKENKK